MVVDTVIYEWVEIEPQTPYEYDWLRGSGDLLDDPTSPPPVPVGFAYDMLDNIISDVLYLCTGEIARAGRRHAEPYADTFGVCIHVSHESDLAVALCDVQLIDANRVDPYVAGLMFVTKVAEGVV